MDIVFYVLSFGGLLWYMTPGIKKLANREIITASDDTTTDSATDAPVEKLEPLTARQSLVFVLRYPLRDTKLFAIPNLAYIIRDEHPTAKPDTKPAHTRSGRHSHRAVGRR